MPLYEEYTVAAKIATTITNFLGVLSLALVVINTRMRFSANDTPSYILLFRIHAIVALLAAASSWTVMIRQSMVNTLPAFAVYGICGVLGAHPCAILDAFNAHLVPFSQTILTVCILFRCLLLYGVVITKTHVYVTVLAVYLTMLPFAILMIATYLPLKSVSPLPESLLQEAAHVPVYFLRLEYGTWLGTLAMCYISVAYFLLPVCFLCFGIMLWKLRQLRRVMMSSRTLDLHKAFVKLLFIEATVLSSFILMATLKGPLATSRLPPEVIEVVSLFNLTLMTSAYPIQGFATLIIVPYMRANVVAWFKSPARVEPGSRSG